MRIKDQENYRSTASEAAIEIMLKADPESMDGRSQWVWMRLPNTDLVFGCYPQGDTYFAAFEGTGDDRRAVETTLYRLDAVTDYERAAAEALISDGVLVPIVSNP